MHSITNTAYIIQKQFNGKFRVKKITTYSNGSFKTKTITKDKDHYFANELAEKLNKNNDILKNGVRKIKSKG